VREELKDIQSQLGITTVYVTHDQEEALSLSDTIAVLHHGQLQQAGSAQEIYFTPKNRFVADFVGRANFIESAAADAAPAGSAGNAAVRMVRPEWLSVHALDATDSAEPGAAGASGSALTGTIVSASFIGSCIRYRLKSADFSGGVCVVDMPTADGSALRAGTQVAIEVQKAYVME
jgi:ABC-type Fe3+/spermidine/putrescine transport system ATPase subunit